MSITVEKVSEFNLNENNWKTYIKQLEFFFEANRILDESKGKAILLSSFGKTTHKLFKGLTASSKPGEKFFDEPKQLMSLHQNPHPKHDSRTFQKVFQCLFQN